MDGNSKNVVVVQGRFLRMFAGMDKVDKEPVRDEGFYIMTQTTTSVEPGINFLGWEIKPITLNNFFPHLFKEKS